MNRLERLERLADLEPAAAIQLLQEFAPDLYHSLTLNESVDRVLFSLAECVDQSTENPADV